MKSLFVIATFSLLFISCQKNSSRPSIPDTPRDSTNIPKDSSVKNKDSIPSAKDSIRIYEGLVFSAIEPDDRNQYFSTIDTSFKTPKSLRDLTASQIKNIDIVYIHDYNKDKPGFIDPIESSKNPIPTEGDIYANPALDSSINTLYYSMPWTDQMKKSDFDSVKAHPYLFKRYFDGLYLVGGGAIFPAGTIIMGWWTQPELTYGLVIGFKNEKSGKRGLIYIRNDQDHGWPNFPETGFRTHVDIIKEK